MPVRSPALASVPNVDSALRRLQVEHIRAFVALVARLLSVAFLIALLTLRLPGLRSHLALANAVGVALIAWPFFTRLGQLYAGRITVGQRLIESQRWSDADRILAPFAHAVRAKLFDAGGEGRFLLAQAWHEEGKEEAARLLWTELAAQQPLGNVGRRAAARLAAQ